MKHVACEELNFIWAENEVSEFEQLWREGRTLLELARYFKRRQEEVLLLALDRAMFGKIKPRNGGLIGEKMP